MRDLVILFVHVSDCRSAHEELDSPPKDSR
jgi:hypothetical protein